jgi:hypothetical protein
MFLYIGIISFFCFCFCLFLYVKSFLYRKNEQLTFFRCLTELNVEENIS